MHILDKSKLILVTGGHGFIGGHIARRLHKDGYRVRVTDILPRSPFTSTVVGEVLIGNLCDHSFCSRVVEGVDTVLHFAATMGGMGTIHAQNDFVIYEENHRMTLNLLKASIASNVQGFFYASSACVYPESLQHATDADVSLAERDVWTTPPQPQGLYGLEKLNSELLFQQYSATSLHVRIGRFHNIYGPMGSWYGGREKVPAAFLRKAIAARLSGDAEIQFEIWGDGEQRRSFCFIEDAVDAVLLLLQSRCTEPVNIGSERAVTIRTLADLALTTASVDSSTVSFTYDRSRPVGVGSRNSDNSFVREILGWEPSRSLEEGMRLTADWIEQEISVTTASMTASERTNFLACLQTSNLVNLEDEAVTFAILLPITSRGFASESQHTCLDNLRRFANSLAETTTDDRGRLGERYRVAIYLAIDEDDFVLWNAESEGNGARAILQKAGFPKVVIIRCNRPHGAVCHLWRDCARRAYQDGCDYYILMGDDVVLQDANWMSTVHRTFIDLSATEGVPMGIGCVAFTDVSFPGMPTFPAVNRIHLDIFDGEVIPEVFTNQDGDPFLFQLYRRWGCSTMIASRIHNEVGGSGPARYEKVHTDRWTLKPLDDATQAVEDWLRTQAPNARRKLTLDVVIPCYRVDIDYVDRFLHLRPSSTCTVMFIIIVDDPQSPHIGDLMQKYGHRPDVRIRVNDANLGASASRNRGLLESAAEWVHFLDDDVTPEQDILVEAEKAINSHPDAAGFVGNAHFPSADSVFTTAVHLAGVTFFWDIAEKIEQDVPWGVTANLIARRNLPDDVAFNLQFPKTGGGEDIDYCRRKRIVSLAHHGGPFYAAPAVKVTHPWWNQGRRSYWRFYMWSKGDGGLIRLYPELSYRDLCPNAAECLLICCVILGLGLCWLPMSVLVALWVLRCGTLLLLSIILSNIVHDVLTHTVIHPERMRDLKTTISGPMWMCALVEGALIRMFSEWGRVVGLLQRGEYTLFLMRFDWFCGVWGDGPRLEEMAKNQVRVGLSVVVFAFLARFLL